MTLKSREASVACHPRTSMTLLPENKAARAVWQSWTPGSPVSGCEKIKGRVAESLEKREDQRHQRTQPVSTSQSIHFDGYC